MACIAAQVQSLEGTKANTLHTTDQQALRIASVTFSKPVDGNHTFSIKMNAEAFTDHFLFMCEFKCVGGAGELMCFVPITKVSPLLKRDVAFFRSEFFIDIDGRD